MPELHGPATDMGNGGGGDVVAVETTAAAEASVRIIDAVEPLVSIIIVTFGTGRVILDALSALADRTRLAVEIVIVDNPPDGRPSSGDLLRSETAGVRLVTPARNLGFGGGNDLGVSMTTGEFVCFLNPDVIVDDGWLEPLVAALDDPMVAIAGPVLLNPDGTIQEAGRVIYADGWTGAIAGRDMLTGDTDQLFARDVDYISAACWVVRRREHVARGFDPRYHPAFFEDVDYALRVESEGQRSRLVVDVPVVHHHGLGGAGRDAVPADSYRTFCSVWNHRLVEQPGCPDSASSARKSRDRLATERVGWFDRSGSPDARRRGLDQAVEYARTHPRQRATFITAEPTGLELDPARRAGVECVVGDVDSLAAERSDELTASREIWPSSLRHGSAIRRWAAAAAIIAVVGVALRGIVLRSTR